MYEILQRQSGQNCSEGTKSLDFFPTHIWIRGLGERVYWLEHGVKYPIDHGVLNENEKHRAIRLSVIDLLQLPTGPQRCSEEALSPTSAYEGALFRGQTAVYINWIKENDVKLFHHMRFCLGV